MISILKQVTYSASERLIEAYGLSTDSKPTAAIANGSMFVEMDTGKVYFYSGASSAWVEFGA